MTEQEQQVLEFEKRVWNRRGNKKQAIRSELRLSPVRYYQLLARILDDPEAIEQESVLVHRLQRITGRRGRR